MTSHCWTFPGASYTATRTHIRIVRSSRKVPGCVWEHPPKREGRQNVPQGEVPSGRGQGAGWGAWPRGSLSPSVPKVWLTKWRRRDRLWNHTSHGARNQGECNISCTRGIMPNCADILNTLLYLWHWPSKLRYILRGKKSTWLPTCWFPDAQGLPSMLLWGPKQGLHACAALQRSPRSHKAQGSSWGATGPRKRQEEGELPRHHPVVHHTPRPDDTPCSCSALERQSLGPLQTHGPGPAEVLLEHSLTPLGNYH